MKPYEVHKRALTALAQLPQPEKFYGIFRGKFRRKLLAVSRRVLENAM